MANTIILRDDHSVRLPYRMLGNALATLQMRLPLDDPARRVIDPWLAHIEEDMGYVNLDEALLEDREGVRRLREELEGLADELERGQLPFPPWVVQRMGKVEYNVKFTLDACRRLAAFLELVIADQAEEDAGRKPPPISEEERNLRRREEVRRQWGPGGNPNVMHVVVGQPNEEARAHVRKLAEEARRRREGGD